MLKWFMLAIYLLLSAFFLVQFGYWYRRLEAHRRHPMAHHIFVGGYILCASTLLLGKLLPDSAVQLAMLKFSNYWLGFLILLLTFQILANLVLLPVYYVNRHSQNPKSFSQWNHIVFATGVIVAILAFVCTIYGGFHARDIKVNHYDVTVHKSCAGYDELNMVLVADLHLGYSIGSKDMERMVALIQEQNSDIVFFSGDIFDNDYDALDDPEHLETLLRSIEAPLGVYAVYGNHDVTETLVGGFPIGGYKNAFRDERMTQFLLDSGMTILDDSSILVADSFYLVGRRDTQRAGDGTQNRVSIESLTENLDKSRPIFVLNHEPDDIQATEDCGADLMLSGHTHAGQFFPLTIAQPFKWPVYKGTKEYGNLTVAVTTGVGVYGPPIRVGTDAEIMCLAVHFEK